MNAKDRHTKKIIDELCQWFALCVNRATGTTTHPILGEVSTCDRCANFADPKGGRTTRHGV